MKILTYKTEVTGLGARRRGKEKYRMSVFITDLSEELPQAS